MFYVYIIQNLKNNLYIGFTGDLSNRIKEHQRGECYTTKRLTGPWNLIYCEGCLDDTDAKKRERFLKTSKGREFIKNRLKYYLKINEKKLCVFHEDK
ncbi:hypothetical protein A2316_00670 [Candidatus Falkowbacteria bacterium RIFOXYB2_FULL_38_15]|uniref:GIY-YIG domain-containing protein n=1 Tax=Candidatus Falkowbacteria bacterium RIFOXYA2_FULL_38_12 TaxID=1797993 RepID=A0A1F5S2I4_9BACT|nr:MAG: hypothetical protein A2257_00165 [Candidatus Falkowbacteria bacterium RIFOXYA2_FULL_38_12]OGF32715.1 MAG: hypothetical protein A2316_00670 [Candidatus Falkowbacteria bacterium RIFOXYB2_FULL_38_15]OGF42249.1 MAG: hypothetical protein A2555_03225 [Candidatus Falkowbacteria bacterium RIFOXYD2_FULL_39_16]